MWVESVAVLCSLVWVGVCGQTGLRFISCIHLVKCPYKVKAKAFFEAVI